MRSQSPENEAPSDEFDDDLTTKVAVPMVGDYTTFTGLHRVILEGVGLVVGLNGTGGDPPPSTYRETLVDDMRRRNIREWKEIIRSPDTALVVVRAYLPPLIAKGDKFDVRHPNPRRHRRNQPERRATDGEPFSAKRLWYQARE